LISLNKRRGKKRKKKILGCWRKIVWGWFVQFSWIIKSEGKEINNWKKKWKKNEKKKTKNTM